MGIQIIGHTSFLGTTGYNNHSRNFFTNLNKYIPTRVRNYTYTPDLSYLKPEEYDLIIEHTQEGHPAPIGRPFTPNPQDTIVNLVLNESHHYYFYDKYEHPMIAYNVWEATKQIPEFFNRILEYDQFWCPTEWQRQCTIDQGYPEDRVKVVWEAVNGNLFKPGVSSKEKDTLYEKYNIPGDAYVCMIFGRWDYRKSVTEMIQAWIDVFGKRDNCYLVASVDNPFGSDGLNSTEERLKHYKLEHERIKVLHFPPREEYVKWMQYGACLLSCSRSEGWNLPLMEALACGTPSICSDWGGHLEFADGVAYKVNVIKELPPKQIFMVDPKNLIDVGVWGEPDFAHLRYMMKKVYKNYTDCKLETTSRSKYIRKLYTWDNAARQAEGFIKELVEKKHHDMKPIETPIERREGPSIKLNLGCGEMIKPGYINIDRYNNTGQVDLKCDMNALPFKDGSVDEVYTSHSFEHIKINDVYGVLEEWNRVLCVGGELVMFLPNLEIDIKHWLETPDDKKWFEIHRIFGGQSYEGNTHYHGHNPESLKMLVERFDFKITTLIGDYDRGWTPEIKLVAKKMESVDVTPPKYITHFVEGPFAEILGDPNDKSFYVVDFEDLENKAMVHQQNFGINCWTRPHRKYYTNWLVRISRNGKVVHEHKFDLTGKNVMVSLDSKSLGDTIAWVPQVEEFRKQRNCTVYLSTFWNHLFKNAYPEIKFIAPGQVVQNLYASYKVGCWEGDFNQNKFDWRTIPLQKVCSDILGLEYKEVIADLAIKPQQRPIKEKYVAITEFSTFQCKSWNYPNGWQEIVDYLNEIGYKVMSVSKEKTQLKNIIKMNEKSIEETITNIAHAEFFMGISTGPAWLAWALKKPVVMISGFSSPIAEFKSDIELVMNTNFCHGCLNDVSYKFDRGDWNWCPCHKGTDRQFECSKSITPDMVKVSINEIIQGDIEDLKINETPNYFYVPPDNKIVNLVQETKGFNWGNFSQFGPVRTTYYEIFTQQDYSHGDCKVEKGDLVVDVGANVGVFTRYAFINGARKILSFEPENVNFDYLLKNKPEICRAFNLAVSDNNDKQQLYISTLEGSHTLISDWAEKGHTLQETQCITLDKMFETYKLYKIDFLKMDIEGSELKAFDGITDDNLNKIRKISIEYHHQILELDADVRKRFIERFLKLGFKSYVLHLKDDFTNMIYFWK